MHLLAIGAVASAAVALTACATAPTPTSSTSGAASTTTYRDFGSAQQLQGLGNGDPRASGDQATITEQVFGLAATFSGAPYPHVQHIHGAPKVRAPRRRMTRTATALLT